MSKLKIVSPLLFNEDDAAWGKWVQFHGDSGGDYRKLLALVYDTGKRKSIRARALLLALLPHDGYAWSPIDVPRDLSSFRPHDLDLSSLDADLARFAAQVVCQCIDRGAEMYSGISTYCQWLRQLVIVLPGEEAKALFSRHPLNDPVPYCNMDWSSGYNPFARMLDDRHLPDEWKRQADDKMRALVLAEIEGHAKPREEWESAPKCYASIVTLQFWAAQSSYGDDLLASQLAFLCEHETMRESVGSVLWLIIGRFRGPEWERLRLQITQVACAKEAPHILNDCDRSAAELLLAEFGDDAQLKASIESALAGYYKRLNEQKAHDTSRKMTEASLDKAMR